MADAPTAAPAGPELVASAAVAAPSAAVDEGEGGTWVGAAGHAHAMLATEVTSPSMFNTISGSGPAVLEPTKVLADNTGGMGLVEFAGLHLEDFAAGAQAHAALASRLARAAEAAAAAAAAAAAGQAATAAAAAARLATAAEAAAAAWSAPRCPAWATADVRCAYCGGAVPFVSLRVDCLDGSTMAVTVPQRVLRQYASAEMATADADAAARRVCEHCGGTVPLISLRVASMDGTTLVVTVAQRGLVREVKHAAGIVSCNAALRG
jgi:hypothetical protein